MVCGRRMTGLAEKKTVSLFLRFTTNRKVHPDCKKKFKEASCKLGIYME